MEKTMKRVTIVVGMVLVALLGYRYLASGPKARNARPQGENIICFGDSLTAGTGAATGMDYPSQLARMIGRPVINAGLPGDTTAGALVRLEQDVLARSPRIVLITIGGNDLTHSVDREVFSRNLQTIITRIQAAGALVVVGGIEVPLRDRGFREGYQEVARATGAILIPNIFQGILGRPDLMSDPIHPNTAGYTLIAERFHETIRPYL
jgi:acyl-CoA thioesterase I